MNHIKVNYIGDTNLRVDMRWLSEALMHADSIDSIKKLSIRAGKQTVNVEKLFEVTGDCPAQTADLTNASQKMDYIGYELSPEYTIQVDGNCGHYTGALLNGGSVKINGNALDFVGCGMRKGVIEITGNANDYVGSAFTGEKRGMAGGLILIHGNARNFVGDLMRRGTIMVAGNIGDYCAHRMIAGTITNLGTIGQHIGEGMRRGTLLIPNKPQEGLQGFSDCGRHSLGYLTLLVKQLREKDSAFRSLHPMRRRVQKYMGDTATGGQGELLIWIG